MGKAKQRLARESAKKHEWTAVTALNSDEIFMVLTASAAAAAKVGVATGSFAMENSHLTADGWVSNWAHRALARNVVASVVITGQTRNDGTSVVTLRLDNFRFVKSWGRVTVNSGKMLDRFRELVFASLSPIVANASVPAAWHPDPYGRHESRYWDGQLWTGDVADSGVTSSDAVM
jgi:Protein of unknown function (DUF2510)